MKNDIRKYGVPLLYGALFIYMVWVMADRMPLYGYLRVGLAVLFFFDYFVWRLFRQSPAMQGRIWIRRGLTAFYFLPFALLLAFCAVLSFRDLQDWGAFWRTYLAGGVFVLLATHFCYGAVWAFFSIIAWVRSRRFARKFPYQAAGYASFLLFLLIVYAMVISTFNLRIDKIDMRRENPDRPVPEGLRGYKILQISDLHIGSFTSARQVRSLVRQALLTRPDMIVFTGDMVNFSTSEMTPFMSDLAHLQAPDGVYCVLGNHDYGNYAQWPDKNAKYANFQKMLDYYKRLGWVALNNASVKIERGGDTLWLIGVENWGKEGRFPKRGNLKKAMLPESVLEVRQSWRQPGTELLARPAVAGNSQTDAGSASVSTDPGRRDVLASIEKPESRRGGGQYTVLLSHDPTHFDSVVYLRYPKIDLTLSGHTHGMQVGFRINGKDYSPARFAYEHFSGMYIMANGQALYVNTGCGFNGIPFRIGMRPNLTLFSL